MTPHTRLAYVLICVLISAVATEAAAQTETGMWDVPRTGGDAITEPSPEATAMRRYQDYPVGHATGTADISIPLVGLQNGNLGVSIGLRYHTGGIKKTDIATSVGLGWSLTGLGCVSRQINGFPDEWRGYGNNVDFDLRVTSGVDVDYLRSVLEAKKDVEYDCYSYNVAGHSGSFYIVNGTAVEYPESELEIMFKYENIDNTGEITKFEIYSPDGMIYTFEEKEYIEVSSNSTSILPPVIERGYKAVSQWNLTKIESVYDRDVITVSYTSRQEWTRISDKMLSGYGFSYYVSARKLYSSSNYPAGPNLDERTTFSNHSMPALISTRGGSIEFTSRSFTTAPYLLAPADYISDIRLKDAAGNVIKKVSLDNSQTFLDGRHKLTGVDIVSDDVLVDRYRFSYNDMTEDFGYDIFGYPNGKGFEPGYNHSVFNDQLRRSPWRETDTQYLADNCLTEIKTITGLSTTITYEPATVYITPVHNEPAFNGNTVIGLRIKNITTTDAATGRMRRRSYEYLNPVIDIPLGSLTYKDFLSYSGIHTYMGPDASAVYSLGITFLPSASLRGAPVENARPYYGKVVEKLDGTDIAHPIMTEYEYDLSDVEATLMLVGRYIPDEQYGLGNNAEEGKSLGSLQNCVHGYTAAERELIKPVASRGYMSRTFGCGPLLERKTEKEWTPSGYRVNSTEEYFYSKTDLRRFACALYCESVVFRYNHANGAESTLNITDFEDVNYFYDQISSYRTVCDSTIATTYYPDGHSRSVRTGYINTVNSGKGGKFPGFYDMSVNAESGVAFSPMGVTVSCGDESISTYTARTANVDTEECFNVYMTGLRRLPVLEKWVTRTATGSDSVLRKTDYGIYGAKRFVRPSSVCVGSAELNESDRVTVSRQDYTSYDALGRIAAMTDAQGRDIEATWDDKYDLLTEMRLPDAGLTTSYTHIPLVGCTSITSPSGKKRLFEYKAGRLVSEKNTAGQQVASYSYSLSGQQEGGGSNLITSTVHDDSGDASETNLYDGFGMAVRTLSDVAGGSKAVKTADYDALDRPVRQYLPVPASDIEDTPDASAYYGDQYPYTAIAYRNLASDKPLDVISEGSLMQGHPTQAEYLCNSTANAMLRCIRYRLAADPGKEKITSDGYYPAGTLDVVRTTDPDGHVSLMFTDWRGFKIMERRVLDASTFADTYFLYDPVGRLRVAIQPEGAALMKATSGSWDNASRPLSKYAFVYRYDSRGNCVSSLVPGGGTVEMRYDTYNRLAFRSTAAMAAAGQTEFTLYDRIARPVVTGISDCDISGIGSPYDMTATFSASADGIDGTGYELQDSGLSALIGGATVSIVNYYDGYQVAGRDGFVSLRDIMPGSMQGAGGLLTATRQAVYSGNYGEEGATTYYQYTLHTYDNEERLVASATSGVGGDEYSLTTTSYSRLGHVNGVTENVIASNMTYTLSLLNTHDALGNISSSKASFGSGQSEIEYSYDALGRKSGMKLSQEEDRPCNYSYDLRGRLKSMISPAFSQELYREDGASPCYNGSISSMRYSYDGDFEEGADNGDKVTYGYDALGRLVGSESTDGYDTSYDYDLNSSPTAIVRNGLTSDGFSIGVVDDLELRYDGNRLKKVVDLADAVNIESSLDFVESSDETGDLYDESGRLTAWPGLEGSSIKYAPNDMPVFINSNKGTVGFRYRADGKKLSTATTGISFIPAIKPDTYTQYDIGSFRFYSSRRNPQMVLERINLPWGYFDSEGMANVYIQDYQGNIRAVYNQDDDCIVQQTDYYPYGLPKATSIGAEVNPFKYGGKELNTHLPQPFYDFVARMQLPQLCLFQRPDPKASDYTWLTPFTYCAGDPINKIDPDGKNIAILLVEGLAGHLALLIQRPDKLWSYYSVNGDKIYEATNGTLGGPTNDVGVGTWESPKDFLNDMNNASPENDGNSTEEMTRYDYSEAYEIATTPEQDKLIAEEFSKIAEEDYDLAKNNCAHAVQRSIIAGNVNHRKKNPLKPSAHVIAGAIVTVPSIGNEYIEIKIRPKNAYNLIIKNNPNGKRYTK